MIVTFQFDTDSENFDNTELEAHYQANNMACCLSEIENKLRSWYKYDERPAIPTEDIMVIGNIIEKTLNEIKPSPTEAENNA